MKHKKLLLTFGAFFGSLFAFLAITNNSAFAATKTWDGGGSDNNFNTAANWDGDSLPSNGDDLVFNNDTISVGTDGDLTNDLTSASFASLTFSGAGSYSYTIDGNAFTLAGTITISTTGSYNYPEIGAPVAMSGDKTITVPSGVTLTFSGALTGSGNVTKLGTGGLNLTGDNSSYTGEVFANAGTLSIGPKGLAGSAVGTVANGADLTISPCGNDTGVVDANLTLDGASSSPEGDSPVAKVTIYTCGGGGGGADEYYGVPAFDSNFELTGSLSLTSDVTGLSYISSAKVTAALSGNYKINLLPGSAGKLLIESSSNTSGMPNGEYSPPRLVKELSDDLPNSSVSATGNTTIVVTGKRGDINLGKGVILKGTGTVGIVTVNEGATLAPGLSPGTLNTGAISWLEGGIYEFEIGKDAADQIKATGTVVLGNGTLTPSLYDGYKPAAGKSYIIIDNDGSDAVTGTFKDLAEGATFTKDGYVYGISYVAGDGNDVSLTIKSVPAAPDTGFGILSQNPLATLAVTLLATGAIAFAAKKYRPVAARR